MLYRKTILISATLLFLCSCRSNHIASIATVEKNSKWKILPECGYEGCLPLVDFLTDGHIKVRIESTVGDPRGIFIIMLTFSNINKEESTAYKFIPSEVSLELQNGQQLNPKGITCSNYRFNLERLWSISPLVGAQAIDFNNDCFVLFFDVRPPSVEETIKMNFQGLIRSGNTINIPQITFKKGIRRW